MDIKTLTKENYLPHKRWINDEVQWIPRTNWSVSIDGDVLYGLPEDCERYFKPQQLKTLKKVW